MKIAVQTKHDEQGPGATTRRPTRSSELSGSRVEGRMNGNIVRPTEEMIPKMPSLDHSRVETSRPALKAQHRSAMPTKPRIGANRDPRALGNRPTARFPPRATSEYKRIGRAVRGHLAQGEAVHADRQPQPRQRIARRGHDPALIPMARARSATTPSALSDSQAAPCISSIASDTTPAAAQRGAAGPGT